MVAKIKVNKATLLELTMPDVLAGLEDAATYMNYQVDYLLQREYKERHRIKPLEPSPILPSQFIPPSKDR